MAVIHLFEKAGHYEIASESVNIPLKRVKAKCIYFVNIRLKRVKVKCVSSVLWTVYLKKFY